MQEKLKTILISRCRNILKCLLTSIRKRDRVKLDYIVNIDSSPRTVDSKKVEQIVDLEVSQGVELLEYSGEVKMSKIRM